MKKSIQDLNEKSQTFANKALTYNRKNQVVQNTVHFSTICPELQKIVNVWPKLPKHIKLAIEVLIQAGSSG